MRDLSRPHDDIAGDGDGRHDAPGAGATGGPQGNGHRPAPGPRHLARPAGARSAVQPPGTAGPLGPPDLGTREGTRDRDVPPGRASAPASAPGGPGGPAGPSGPDGPEGPDGDSPADDRRLSRRARKGKPPRSLARTIIEWVAVIGGGVVIALVIEAFLVQAFWIPSPSMVPTLGVGDRVLVNKLSYRLHDVHRGDVIVFERPEDAGGDDDGIRDLIKRVIAVGGDEIEARNGLVYVNGDQVDESDYLEPGTPTDNLPRTVVPEGEVFVMGDNRTNSQDSREFGSIDEDTIVGRAFIRVLPLNDIGWL